MSEKFLKVTHGRTDRRTEPLPELLSELKRMRVIETITTISFKMREKKPQKRLRINVKK